jgi:hypothetical protein
MGSRLLITFLVLLTSAAGTNAFASFGRTAGTSSVSSTGGAQYTIPIWTPPGIRGIQPRLAFAYDSQFAYGIMGRGWTLTGLSSISRCNRTYAQDGAPSPIALTYADAFCLDGNRLRLTSSETLSTYGAANTTYQTEIANFSQVTASSTLAGSGPSYFTVQGKDGLTYEYGNTTDSKIIPTGATTPYVWALDKVTDRAGNQMTYTYLQAGGGYVPHSIQYTAASGSTDFPYQVQFVYTEKASNDFLTSFIAGTQVQQTQQLSTITMTSSGTIVREYKLGYTTSGTTLRATLTSIQECANPTGPGGTASDCFVATSISYQPGSAGIANATAATGTTNATGPLFSVDIDGDGRKDLVYGVFDKAALSNIWFAQLATATGYGPSINIGAVCPQIQLGNV